jgi:hypothetical protein
MSVIFDIFLLQLCTFETEIWLLIWTFKKCNVHVANNGMCMYIVLSTLVYTIWYCKYFFVSYFKFSFSDWCCESMLYIVRHPMYILYHSCYTKWVFAIVNFVIVFLLKFFAIHLVYRLCWLCSSSRDSIRWVLIHISASHINASLVVTVYWMIMYECDWILNDRYVCWYCMPPVRDFVTNHLVCVFCTYIYVQL